MSFKFNTARAIERRRKVVKVTPEKLEELGETGLPLADCAKLVGYRHGQELSKIINSNLTNRQAFDKGRLKAKENGKRTRKV